MESHELYSEWDKVYYPSQEYKKYTPHNVDDVLSVTESETYLFVRDEVTKQWVNMKGVQVTTVAEVPPTPNAILSSATLQYVQRADAAAFAFLPEGSGQPADVPQDPIYTDGNTHAMYVWPLQRWVLLTV